MLRPSLPACFLVLTSVVSAPAFGQSVTGTASAATQLTAYSFSNFATLPAGTNLTNGVTLVASDPPPAPFSQAIAGFSVTNSPTSVAYVIAELAAWSGSFGFPPQVGPHGTLLTLTSTQPVMGTLTITHSQVTGNVSASVDVGNDGSVEWSAGQPTWQQQIALLAPLQIRTSTSAFDASNHTLTITFVPDPLPQLPLTNPAFENGLSDWFSFGQAFVETAAPPEFEPRSGSALLKLFGNFSGTFNASGVFQTFAAAPGETYRLDCWARHFSGDPLTGPGQPIGNFATKKIAFFDAAGNELAAVEGTVLDGTSPTDTWLQTPPVFATAPAGTASVRALLLFLQPGLDPGAAQFDDVSFTRFTATVEPAGSSQCPTAVYVPRSFSFSRDGLGNYIVSAIPSAFEANIGPSLGFTVDDTKQEDFDLGFAFPWPSGADNLIDIDPNGRILPGASTELGDYSPTPGEHALAEAIAVFWTDLNVTEPGSGNVHLTTDPGLSATITWNGVKQYSNPDANAPGVTVQVKMLLDGSFVITHEDLVGFNAPGIRSVIRGGDLLVGFSDGAGIDPGELDLTALPVTVPIGVNYEHWQSTGPAPIEPTDLVNYLAPYQGSLVGLTDPVIGSAWTVQLQGPGSAVLGFYLVGFAPASLDLSAFGSPCMLLVNAPEVIPTFATGGGLYPPWTVTIPNAASLFGAQLYVQGALEQAPQPPFSPFFGLPWRFSFTDSIVGTVGPL